MQSLRRIGQWFTLSNIIGYGILFLWIWCFGSAILSPSRKHKELPPTPEELFRKKVAGDWDSPLNDRTLSLFTDSHKALIITGSDPKSLKVSEGNWYASDPIVVVKLHGEAGDFELKLEYLWYSDETAFLVPHSIKSGLLKDSFVRVLPIAVPEPEIDYEQPDYP